MPPRPPSPEHVQDPSARWEAQRRRWLAPISSSSSSSRNAGSSSPPSQPADGDQPPSPPAGERRQRDPLFQQRIATLEAMLRSANGQAAPSTSSSTASPSPIAAPPTLLPVPAHLADADGAGSSGSAATAMGKAREEEDEPDGGAVVGAGRDGGQGDATLELKKVSEGIFLAFKQNRALKEPLPLSLVTSLLFRSWMLDGTIPLNYVPEPEPPMPVPRSVASLSSAAASTPTSALPSPPIPVTHSAFDSSPASGTPGLLASLAAKNSDAVTPLATSSSSPSSFANPLDVPPPHPSDSSLMPPPSTIPKKPDPHPLQPPSAVPDRTGSTSPPPAPNLERFGETGESGKLRLDMMRGSRWRTERDVASGSDVI
ncbi:hypothetical protein JCM8097_004620 [Rhodosporidiobolus ruineniae]